MLESVFHILKITVILTMAAAFLLAINTFIGLVGTFTSEGFIGEFFALVSMYMPFNASVVFGGILTACSGIFAFLIAKKIWELGSWSLSAV